MIPEGELLTFLNKAKQVYHRKKHKSYKNIIISADTETCQINEDNAIVTHYSICLLDVESESQLAWHGGNPWELCDDLEFIRSHSNSSVVVFFHFLNYDWTFLRKFFISRWGIPANELNIKPHRPVSIEFECGIEIRDTLILASGRNLSKWAKDLNVKHQKAMGMWDYEKQRKQGCALTPEEELYILNDVRADAECVFEIMKRYRKSLTTLPLTATGLIRDELKAIARKNYGHRLFLQIANDYSCHQMLEAFFHGGYVHGNRKVYDISVRDCRGYDFASSYPFVLISEKYPMERFFTVGTKHEEGNHRFILENSDEYAYIFILCMKNVRMKEDVDTPLLSQSKCEKMKLVNAVIDNGRVMDAEFVICHSNEIFLNDLLNIYDIEQIYVCNVWCAKKARLPKYITDFIFDKFKDKTKLKGVDDILYTISKYNLNGIYGMMVQKPINDDVIENFKKEEEVGVYSIVKKQNESEYDKYLTRHSSILSFAWGAWTTSYAQRNLLKMCGMCETWIYSDTDSAYGIGWNEALINDYNQKCKQSVKNAGYHGVEKDGITYHLGIAETESSLNPNLFKHLGSKKYAKQMDDGSISITVAGVPKKAGAGSLKSLDDFKKGFIFKGKDTGKIQFAYHYTEKPWIDDKGQWHGDCVTSSPCDYEIGNIRIDDAIWKEIYYDTVL